MRFKTRNKSTLQLCLHARRFVTVDEQSTTISTPTACSRKGKKGTSGCAGSCLGTGMSGKRDRPTCTLLKVVCAQEKNLTREESVFVQAALNYTSFRNSIYFIQQTSHEEATINNGQPLLVCFQCIPGYLSPFYLLVSYSYLAKVENKMGKRKDVVHVSLCQAICSVGTLLWLCRKEGNKS